MGMESVRLSKTKLIILMIFAVVCLSGCLRVSADDLYALPQVSQLNLRLQSQLNSILSQGAEFSPPTSGPNRQAVQLKDLDGDGINEVLAFFSVPGESTLKIFIFEMSDEDYAVVEIIEGLGTAFESVRYSDMDGDGVREIIVGWQMGAALKLFSIYSIKDFRAVQLAREEYSEIIVFDITGDGRENVIALRLPTQDLGGLAQLYTLMPDGEIVNSEARLSAGVEALARVQTGRLSDEIPAIFVDCAGRFDEGVLVTDVFALQDGVFTNISLAAFGGISEDTLRARTIYSSDITKAGKVMVPVPRLLKAQSETPYYVIDWHTYSSEGMLQLELTTYHNYFDEWYLILPLDWRSRVSVRREDAVSGERTVIFSYISGEEGPYHDFLKVYKLTGEVGEERSVLPGRTVLMSEGSTIYAFELLTPANSFDLTFDEALIKENFRLIYSDWLAGTG